MIEDKVTLASKRAALIASIAHLPAEEHPRVQAELSVVNAQIKALNTTEAAQLKAAADRRKAAGLAEAQANAARALAHARMSANGGDPQHGPDIEDDHPEHDDPGQAAAIDTWIMGVLQRGGVQVRRAKDGAINLFDVPMKWALIIDGLSAGLHAAARGDELPEIAAAEPKRIAKAKKRS